MSTSDGGMLGNWYRNRIGEPQTDDEMWGYWTFVLGALLGVLALVLFLTTTPDTSLRALGYASGAGALALLLFAPVIRLPLSQTATWLSGMGVVVCAGAILYFFTIYPDAWTRPNGNVGAIVTYAAGIVLILIGGIFMPMVQGRATDEHEAAERRADAATERATQAEGDAADAEASLEEALEELAETQADLDAAQATLAEHSQSQAAFELYEDAAGEWRWRLRHRNGNIIADGGEGYASRQKVMQGLQSVKRNAFGAAVAVQSTEEDAPAEQPAVLTEESQATFEYYEDAGGEWRWRLRHDNGEIIADGGEGYHNRSNVTRAIDRVSEQVGQAPALDIDPTGFEVYADAAGEYRWRLLHRNGNILAESGQGYESRSNAARAVETVQDLAADEDAFEVYEDNAGEYRWRLVATNGENVADGAEGYASKSGAEDAVERVSEYAPAADHLDVSGTVFEIYEDEGEEWRWRLRNRNGNIVADSGEGYTSRSEARDAVDRVKRHAPGADSEVA